MVCAVFRGRVKPTKHFFLFIVKSLTGNTKLVHTANWLWDSVPSLYLARENWNSTVSTRDDIPIPVNIYSGAFTTLPLYGNIENLDKTVSGARTSHRVNNITIQADFIGPPPRGPSILEVSKYERRNTGLTPQGLPVHNAGQRVGPTQFQLEIPIQLQLILQSW